MAASRSASSKMMLGALLPNSRDSRFRLPAEAWTMPRPTSVDPVKAILFTPRCAAKVAPITEPRPVSTLTTPGGKPASSISSPRRTTASDASCAGLKTTVLPHASAGLIFCRVWMRGKFQGMMMVTTPNGSRRV